jgi:DNA-directed RNA polymerase subunit RPC12/RpoP
VGSSFYRDDYDAGDISWKPYDGIACPHCGAKFQVDAPTVEGSREVQCPNCNCALQIEIKIQWVTPGPPTGYFPVHLREKDWLRCAQCGRDLPSHSEKPIDPVGVLLNELGQSVLCEECDWMRENAERRRRR